MGDYTEHLISLAGGDGEPDALDLDAIQARVDAATEGPWFREYSDVVTAYPDPRDVEEGYEDARNARVVRGAPHLPKKDRQGIADATFIAQARTDVQALLALVREQAAQIERVKALADEIAEGASHSLLNKIFARNIRAALTTTDQR